MIKLMDILYESKQIGDLYHLIDFNRLKYILSTNTIINQNFYNISTTTNKNLNDYLGAPVQLFFKLQLDGDKLNDIYKISDFVYTSNNGQKFTGEKEKLIKTNKISNIKKYIKHLIIIKPTLENYSRILTHQQIGQILYNAIQLSKSNGISILIQDGSKLTTSDSYINNLIDNKDKFKFQFYYPPYYKNKAVKLGSNDKYLAKQLSDVTITNNDLILVDITNPEYILGIYIHKGLDLDKSLISHLKFIDINKIDNLHKTLTQEDCIIKFK